MFSYRSILKQAWNISWKHKYLWFFGLFASLAAAGGSIEYQILTKNLNQNLVDGSYSHLSSILALGDIIKSFCLNLVNLFSYDLVSILNAITLLLISLTLVVVFIWLAISSQAALVDNVKKIINPKKKLANLKIRDGLATGNKYFWSVLGLNILIKILVNLAFFIISLPLLFMILNEATILVVIYTLFFIIFVPVAVSLSLLVKYAIAYNVLENKSLITSLEKGWELFKKNWLISLEMAIILFIVNFLAGIVVLIIISLFLFPLFLLGAMFSITWLIILTVFLGLILIVIIGSLLTTFQIATWTDLFLHLTEKKGEAKLERIFKRKK